ncbi:MAG: anaerobic sulfatase maturase [Lentisphaerae bacterium]|nr:anaerobic sulfatase maturase [Lentisphaerota bacterium]
MRPFSLLIKPASGDCNLQCNYCFYTRKCALFPDTARHRMTTEVLERTIASYMATSQPTYSFGWQGGEPTLMGLDFYRHAVALQQRFGSRGALVANGFQTNATLLDDAFASFLAAYNFLVGVSLDGPADLHDQYRRHAAGRGSHADVMRGIDCLRRAKVEFNILILVSAANVGHARTVYRNLTDQGLLFHQYIPCVEMQADGSPAPYTITASDWGQFLCDLFDVWHPADARRVSIRNFDAILAKLVDGQDAVCTMARNCCQYVVVEHNGNVYPCDFFVEPELLLGNVIRDDWPGMSASPVYREFGARKARWHPACDDCEFVTLCQGDCLKHRVPAGSPTVSCSHLCAGWKQFFAHTLPRFHQLAGQIRAQRRAVVLPRGAPSVAVGRNAPCPCGSGRKFKQCCGR